MVKFVSKLGHVGQLQHKIGVEALDSHNWAHLRDPIFHYTKHLISLVEWH
jgi:hypothetical protein